MSTNKNKDNKSEELGKHPINQLLLKYSLPAIIASTVVIISGLSVSISTNVGWK